MRAALKPEQSGQSDPGASGPAAALSPVSMGDLEGDLDAAVRRAEEAEARITSECFCAAQPTNVSFFLSLSGESHAC